jgi:hypothetical protein
MGVQNVPALAEDFGGMVDEVAACSVRAGCSDIESETMKDPIRVVTPKLLLDVGYRYRSVPEIPSEDLAPVIVMLRELGLDRLCWLNPWYTLT